MTQPADPDFRHPTPADLHALIELDPDLADKWAGLTPLARNEWICWMSSAKQDETRRRRMARLQREVAEGKKRPCCWPGCPHRRQSARIWVAP